MVFLKLLFLCSFISFCASFEKLPFVDSCLNKIDSDLLNSCSYLAKESNKFPDDQTKQDCCSTFYYFKCAYARLTGNCTKEDRDKSLDQMDTKVKELESSTCVHFPFLSEKCPKFNDTFGEINNKPFVSSCVNKIGAKREYSCFNQVDEKLKMNFNDDIGKLDDKKCCYSFYNIDCLIEMASVTCDKKEQDESKKIQEDTWAKQKLLCSNYATYPSAKCEKTTFSTDSSKKKSASILLFILISFLKIIQFD